MVGLYPTTPLQEAGMRMEPIVSVPRASGEVPVPTHPPEPPLVPPVLYLLSKAQEASPKCALLHDVP